MYPCPCQDKSAINEDIIDPTFDRSSWQIGPLDIGGFSWKEED